MSSDESRTTSSSRLSQFGLYRTIDARTEEFLRLSRKRQLRQGCACAAVSTAITVTVVVTVLLVYEYNINLNTKADQKPIRRPNWFGFFNDTSSFDAKYKAKLNIDPTTLKLLPIILKALNHNSYLEKLIENSSSSPTLDKTDTTEISYQKNVFSNIKNWVRKPTPKINAKEYKISPVVYYKIPKKNLDDFTKHRKLRDYQRIISYFDKMMSDRVKGLNLPTIYEYRTENYLERKPSTLKGSNKTKKHVESIIRSSTSKDTIPKRITSNCNCSRNLGILLNKLISSIREILPEIVIAKSPCKDEDVAVESNDEATVSTAHKVTVPTINENSVAKLLKPTVVIIAHPTPVNLATTTRTITKQYNTQRKQYSSHKTQNNLGTDSVVYTTDKKYLAQKTNTHFTGENTKTRLNDVIRKDLLVQKHNSIKETKQINNYTTQTNVDVVNVNDTKNINVSLNIKQTTTQKAYIEAPNIDGYLRHVITEPMPKAPVQKDLIKMQKKPQSEINIEPQQSIIKEVNDITTTTEYRVINLEQISEKLPSKNKGIEPIIPDETSTSDNYFDVNIKDLNLFSLRKVGDLVIPAILKDNNNVMQLTTASDMVVNPDLEQSNFKHSNTINTPKIDQESTTKQGYGKGLDYVRAVTEYDIPIEEHEGEETDKTSKIDKYTPNSIMYRHAKEEASFEKSKIKESKESNSRILQSMLPHSRPTYLEINRNHDWKQDDLQDYNTNINHDYFI